MKCFVTGATGFLGSHVARQLLARGADLRLLVRPTSRLDNIADLAAEHVIGDLRDPDSLKQGMEGCEFVFHVAADYRLWSLNHQELYDSNVEGTRNILRAARDSGVRRVIYTSSVATMGFGNNGRLTDEKSPVTLANMIGDYKRSKFMAEQLVLEAGRSGQNVVMVNPTTPVGERDIKPTPSGQIILDFLRRKFPAYVDTGLNLVDVIDCADGHLLAMEKAQPGERYILGGENLTLKQILDKLGAITGLPSPKMKLPYAVALATGVVDTVVTGKILQARAARHDRRSAHGPQEDVRHQRQGRARVGMESAAGRRSFAARGGVVPGERLCRISRSRLSPPCRWNWRHCWVRRNRGRWMASICSSCRRRWSPSAALEKGMRGMRRK